MTFTEQQSIEYLTTDGGRVPCSRYGYDSQSCAPVAYAAALILEGETGEPMTLEDLDHTMGLVVNDHDDIEYMLREYGSEYGFAWSDLFESGYSETEWAELVESGRV